MALPERRAGGVRQEMPEPLVALLATGRSTFVQAAGRAGNDGARKTLVALGARIEGPTELIEFADQVAAGFPNPGAALNILLCATFADASVALAAFAGATGPVVLWALRDPAPSGERLYINSLCGANLAAHALVAKGVQVHLLYGNPDEPRVRAWLQRALEGHLPAPAGAFPARGKAAGQADVDSALASLRGQVIGVVGGVPTGFTTCEYEPAWLRSRLGLETRTMALDDAFAMISAVPTEARAAEVAAATAISPSLGSLPADEVDRFGAVATALRGWAQAERLAGLALRCWPEFPLEYGVCPCSALGRLASGGIATACEADVNGAATMLVMGALDPDHGLTYLADVVRIDEEADTATFWHCGLAPVELAADPAGARQDLHCNRGIGVAGNFPLRTGRVTIARISRSREGYRMLLAGGEALPGPNRFKGNSVDVAIDGGAAKFVTALVERGFEHHTVLAWTELRPQLRRAAISLGLELVEP